MASKTEKSCKREGRRVVTGEVLIANHALTSPQNYFGSAKYGATVIFPEFYEQTASTIQEAMYAAFEERGKKFFDKNGNVPKFEEFVSPLRRHNTNSKVYFLRAMTRNKPTVVDKSLKLIDDTTTICENALSRVSFLFDCAYISAEDKRIIFAVLQNAQILNNSNHGSLLEVKTENYQRTVQDDFIEKAV